MSNCFEVFKIKNYMALVSVESYPRHYVTVWHAWQCFLWNWFGLGVGQINYQVARWIALLQYVC